MGSPMVEPARSRSSDAGYNRTRLKAQKLPGVGMKMEFGCANRGKPRSPCKTAMVSLVDLGETDLQPFSLSGRS
jgi:hypothetical protein